MSEDDNTNSNDGEGAQDSTTQDSYIAALKKKRENEAAHCRWQDGILSEYISPEQLAVELEISKRTLDRWYSVREGPPRTKIGKRTVYRRESVAKWLCSQEIEAA